MSNTNSGNQTTLPNSPQFTFSEQQEETRMKVRMHIIEESKLEQQEMPQDWHHCNHKNSSGKACCFECGCLNGSIKEPRFMKNTFHINPLDHYAFICKDQNKMTKKILNVGAGMSNGSSSSQYKGSQPKLQIQKQESEYVSFYTASEIKFIQGIRELAVMKILEGGVRLCLKLQTSHIASMFFEAWLDKNKRNDWAIRDSEEKSWIKRCKEMSDKQLRQYLDLITLTCILLAAKANEQNMNQPTISDIQKMVRDRYSYKQFVDMEKYLIVECLDWTLNITTPYHFSDSIQGMGCLFWSDFDDGIKTLVDKGDKSAQEKMVLFMIQNRKFINYFVEQSLLLGLWGKHQHDQIAFACILLARFEMLSINQIRWKRKAQKVDQNSYRLLNLWNDGMSNYGKLQSKAVKEIMVKLYGLIYTDAKFPFDDLFHIQLHPVKEHIFLSPPQTVKSDNRVPVTGGSVIPMNQLKPKGHNRAVSEKQRWNGVKNRQTVDLNNIKLPNIMQTAAKRNNTGAPQTSRLRPVKVFNEMPFKNLRGSQRLQPLVRSMNNSQESTRKNTNVSRGTNGGNCMGMQESAVCNKPPVSIANRIDMAALKNCKKPETGIVPKPEGRYLTARYGGNKTIVQKKGSLPINTEMSDVIPPESTKVHNRKSNSHHYIQHLIEENKSGNIQHMTKKSVDSRYNRYVGKSSAQNPNFVMSGDFNTQPFQGIPKSEPNSLPQSVKGGRKLVSNKDPNPMNKLFK